jgi:hypothetical protein
MKTRVSLFQFCATVIDAASANGSRRGPLDGLAECLATELDASGERRERLLGQLQ